MYKYKSPFTPDLLSRSFPHHEVTGYWIVRVSFPLLGSVYNFSQLQPLLLDFAHILIAGTLTVQDILDVTHPTNAPV